MRSVGECSHTLHWSVALPFDHLEPQPSSLAMWKFCEVEICPWHEKRSKRKEFYANRKSKKKIFRKDNESDNDREKSDDTAVKTKMRGNVDHTEKKTLPTEVISQVQEPDRETPKTENKKKPSSALKRRPKTAPPTTQNQQVP